MSLTTLIFLAFGLAVDAFAVSIASGLVVRRRLGLEALKFGCFFGAFQALMPIGGWALGSTLRVAVDRYDHWVAFALLLFIGIKMIREGCEDGPEKERQADFSLRTMLILSFATSIDAFAAGLSLAFTGSGILLPALFIGAVTFVLSATGVWIGRSVGHFFEKKITIIGGLVLIGIGIKIVWL